jgi:hypothetical protein
LIKAGFIINEEKSIWVPCPVLEWLGFLWNPEEGYIDTPLRKRQKLVYLLSQALSGNYNFTPRSLPKIVGKVVSMTFSLGNICNIMTRHCQCLIASSIVYN